MRKSYVVAYAHIMKILILFIVNDFQILDFSCFVYTKKKNDDDSKKIYVIIKKKIN